MSPTDRDSTNPERQPLLQNSYNGSSSQEEYQQEECQQEHQQEEYQNDPTNPRNWPRFYKYLQVAQIFLLAFVCPSASSMFAPAIDDITQTFRSTRQFVLLGQTGFVCMLGIGPLFLAPMSETFGRRKLFLGCLAVFAVLQIPCALVRGMEEWVAVRTLSGLFGSVGVANGGGSISDMFETRERAVVLGVYLIAPLLGPSVGPLIGGLIVAHTSRRWIFGFLGLVSAAMVIIFYFFLYETNAAIILQQREAHDQQSRPDANKNLTASGTSGSASLLQKVLANSTRAIKILTTQPIVFVMSLYQALVFSSMYSLYATYTQIWTSPPYNFTKTQLGLAYLGPAIGFIITSLFIVAYIDKLYNALAQRYGDDGQPEYRLPMANIGALFLPTSLFWFGWTVEKGLPWPVPLAATLLFGASQVSIFNTVQTYYIDAYESRAASALAAGAFLRSVAGGIVPLFVGGMFEQLGYGWGMSVFGFIGVVLMPAPLVFYLVGRRLREKVPFKG